MKDLVAIGYPRIQNETNLAIFLAKISYVYLCVFLVVVFLILFCYPLFMLMAAELPWNLALRGIILVV